MKQIKRLFAAMIAILLVLPLFGTRVFAADYDETVTVEGLQEGDVAHFYKVVEWVGDDTPVPTDAVKGWKAVDKFSDVLNQATLTAVLVGDPSATPPKDPSGITWDIAKALEQKITAATPVDTGTAVTVATGETSAELDVTADGFGPGIYMVIITPSDPDVVYNPVFVSSDFSKPTSGNTNTHTVDEDPSYGTQEPNAIAKKVSIPLKKEPSSYDGDTGGATDVDGVDPKYMWLTTAIGDTVNYTVTTKIPGYGPAYTAPMFKLTDKLSDLELVSCSVKLNKPTGLTKDTDYTIQETTTGYTVEFLSDYLKTCEVPTDVEVTYSAIVTSTAALHVNEEKNEVWTEFSHNPLDASDHSFKRDTTQHYTFTLDADAVGPHEKAHGEKTSELVKVGLDAAGNPIKTETQTSAITTTEKWEGPLAGAKFGLFTDAECTTAYVPKEPAEGAGNPAIVTTGADGRMTFKGLDAGTYYLTEIEAPPGYIKDSRKVPVVIEATYKKVSVTEYTNGTDWKKTQETGYDEACTFETEVLDSYTVTVGGVKTAEYHFVNEDTDAMIDWTVHPPVEKPFPFVNTQGTELPDTGGIGTTLFYIFGGVMVLGAGILLVSRQRMMN